MKTKCDPFEEAIWNHARTGEPLSEAAARHIDECGDCARALEEARLISGMVCQVARVPEGPDCRRAVMARISGARAGRRPAWAYAFAVAAAAMVIVVGLVQVVPRSHGPSRQVAVRRTPAPAAEQRQVVAVRKPPLPLRERVGVRGIVRPPEVGGGTSPEKRRQAAALHRPKRRHFAAVQTPSPQPLALAPQSPAPGPSAPAPEPERAVTAVVVRWPSAADQTPESYSYSYVDRDTATGETTSLSVTGDSSSVKIYFESTPEGGETPERGSIDNGTKSNA